MMHRNNIHYVELSCDEAVYYITKMMKENEKYGLIDYYGTKIMLYH